MLSSDECSFNYPVSDSSDTNMRSDNVTPENASSIDGGTPNDSLRRVMATPPADIDLRKIKK